MLICCSTTATRSRTWCAGRTGTATSTTATSWLVATNIDTNPKTNIDANTKTNIDTNTKTNIDTNTKTNIHKNLTLTLTQIRSIIIGCRWNTACAGSSWLTMGRAAIALG